jgi:peroxiredoxin
MANKIRIEVSAPDFALTNVNGQIIHLSDYQNNKKVLLCLIRGFA